MVDAGSPLTTERARALGRPGPSAARADADPYTRAHFARLGMLPLSAEMSPTYVACTDSDGSRLHSSCDYVVEGREPGTSWWSLTVFDDRRPSHRQCRRSATPSPATTIALRPDGTFTVTLARDARPGNWLPTGGAGRLALDVHDVRSRHADARQATARAEAAAHHPPGAMPMKLADILKNANWQLDHRRADRGRHPAHLRHARRALSHGRLRLQPAGAGAARQQHAGAAASPRPAPSRCRSCRPTRAMRCAASMPRRPRDRHRDAAARSRLDAHRRLPARRQHLRRRPRPQRGRRRSSLVLLPSEEHSLGVTPEARGIARDMQPPTPVSATRGIVVVRGPDKGLSYQRQVEAELKDARCTARSF